MPRRSTLILALGALGLAVGYAACSDSTAPQALTELDGPSVSVGNGSARAVVMKRGSTVQSVGIQLTDDALTNLPATMPETDWMLTLPAGSGLSPWDHLALDWNPQGHPPPMVYTVPHFDFHFYMISPAAQAAIQGGPDQVPVPAQYVPQDYAS